jgi:hypothetical protein
MKVNVNPMLEIEVNDAVAIRKVIRMCHELMGACASMTMTDDAYIACADNGEIIATEKELYSMTSVLVTLDRIFDEAPYKNGDTTCGYKELAVYFGD